MDILIYKKLSTTFLIGLKLGSNLGIGVHDFLNYHMYVSFQIFGSKLLDDSSVFWEKNVENPRRAQRTMLTKVLNPTKN